MRDFKSEARQMFLIADVVKASGMSGGALVAKVRQAIPRLPTEARAHFETAFAALDEQEMTNEQVVEFFRGLARWMESGMKNDDQAGKQ